MSDTATLINTGFDPRPRERGDVQGPHKLSIELLFRSTPPREGRLAENEIISSIVTVSIHAPARGATAQSAL